MKLSTEVMKNSCAHFGCVPINKFVNCFVVNDNMNQEPFINVLHLISDEITLSEVDVMIRKKGQSNTQPTMLGKVTELKVSLGQAWIRIDSTTMQPETAKYIVEKVKAVIPFAANRPYLVSEHVNFMNPELSVIISREVLDGIELNAVAWIEIEV